MKKLGMLLLAGLTALPFGGVISKGIKKDASREKEYIYHEDFEGKDITGDSNANKSVDKATGFIFANDFQHTVTVDREGSRMLDYKINSQVDSYGNFVIGWIGGQSTLNQLTLTETYVFECYLEFREVEFLYVEYKSDHYGAIKLYPDGAIKGNDGNNMVDASYDVSTHQLSLQFTAHSFAAENGLGYFSLLAHQPTEQAKLYLDDLAIYRAEHVMNGTFEEYPLGDFDCNETEYQSNVYVNGDTSAKIVGTEANHKLEVTSTSGGLSNFYNFMYMNRLGVMTLGRKYTITFDYEVDNLLFLWIFYRGEWSHPSSGTTNDCAYAKIDFVWGGVTEDKNAGNCDFQVSLDKAHQKITVSFICSTEEVGNPSVDPYQLMFAAKDNRENTSRTGIRFTIDNFQIDVERMATAIELDTTDFVSMVEYEQEIDFSQLKVVCHYSDGEEEILSFGDYEISGYDKNVMGEQVVTISYQGLTKTMTIRIKGVVSYLVLSTYEITLAYGQKLDLSTLEVKAVYTDHSEQVLSNEPLLGGYVIDWNGFCSNIAGEYVLTISYEGKSVKLTVTVSPSDKVTFDDIVYVPTK